VFISHASADAPLALRICEGLESRGVACWIAPRDVQAEGTYGTEILKGLRECDVFLIIVTDRAAESQQVEREAERASHYKKRIIPLTVGDSDAGPQLEFYIAGRQRFLCSPTPDERFLDRLADAMRGGTVAHPMPAARPSSRTRLLLMIIAGVAAIGLAYFGATYFLDQPAPGVPTPSPATSESRNATPERSTAAGNTAPGTESAPSVSNPKADAPLNTTTTAKGSNPPAQARDRNEPALDVSRTPPRVPPAATSTAAPTKAGGVTTTIVNGVRLSFVAIPGGTFRMGCSAGDNQCEDDEKPVRNVAVDPFEMSTTEVTQELWQAVMGANPSDFTGATLPVQHVSWQDSQDFVDRLNQRRDGFTYRLPNEAEWEYAARANESAAQDLPAIAWFGLAAGSARSPRPQNVGTKNANRWGLHDMLGNVAEWCEDWYSPNFQRVIRGGSWIDSAKSLRVSARGKAVPTTRDYSTGLRLVRTRG
jgi:formylglycine-generating enzyme required for sulfatase activity